jgi:hypothetical protein
MSFCQMPCVMNVILLNATKLNVILLNASKLNVILLNATKLNVMLNARHSAESHAE